MTARGVTVHPERDQRIVQLRLEGAKLACIARHLGLSVKAVGHVLIRNGVTARIASPDQRQRAIALARRQGTGAASRAVGFSPFTVRRWVRRADQEASRG